ncbi:MAG: MBL fold metallo-hydrolase [Lachnospiraceae bacterium]|nr:MBL fold metallo-hydrolase [Lachnospiraceae bacterium]
MHELLKNQYTHETLLPGLTWIYDGINDSIYVDESDEAAFVIDTGMLDQNLTEYIRKNITEKPLTLVVTHGHGDHVMRAAEFGSFYMSAKDDRILPARAGIDLANRIDVKDRDIIKIPGLDLVAVDSTGHTPGSLSFIDRKHQVVFSGDAFSSGANVWMQLPGCTDLSAYRACILKAIETMREFGVDENWTFAGGHYEQKFGFPDPKYQPNEPGITLMAQMAELCRMLVEKEIEGEIVPEMDRFGDTVYSARYEKAWILYTLKQVK